MLLMWHPSSLKITKVLKVWYISQDIKRTAGVPIVLTNIVCGFFRRNDHAQMGGELASTGPFQTSNFKSEYLAVLTS